MAVQTIDPWKVIPADEFRARQERVREAAVSQGLDAAVVYSRGGAFMDMSADVLYLTNHYSQQPYMGDDAGVGTARSHGVAIIPADGPATVVVDIPWWRRDLVVADQVRPSIDVTGTTAGALNDLGLRSRPPGNRRGELHDRRRLARAPGRVARRDPGARRPDGRGHPASSRAKRRSR